MKPISLQKRAKDLKEQLLRRISELNDEDLLKEWFSTELNSIADERDKNLSLVESNAQLRALRQIESLLDSHHLKLNSGSTHLQEAINFEESYYTIESRLPTHTLDNVRTTSFSIAPALLQQVVEDNVNFDAVSPTAKVVSHLRGESESQSFVETTLHKIEGQAILKASGIISEDILNKMGLLFQSRYEAINAAITEQNTRQIVELASGISPRGMNWSRNYPDTIFVESDLPQLMKHKAKMIRDTLDQLPKSPAGILHCCPADVLSYEQLQRVLESLDPSISITVITEGLLIYFDEDEMRQFWTNMKQLMISHPNLSWVTDLVSGENLQELFQSDPLVAKCVQKVFSKTGRNVVRNNPFNTEEEIRNWIHEFDLNVESTIPLAQFTKQAITGNKTNTANPEAIVGTRKIWCLNRSNKPSDFFGNINHTS